MAGGTFLPPVVAEILAKTDQFTAGMMEARGEMTATVGEGSSSFGKLASVGKAAFIGLGVAAVGVGVESVKMADEFEGAHTRLEVAVKNTGSSYEVWAGQIKTTDSTLEHLGFTNTDTQDSLGQLTNATHDTGKALGQMGLAADIARGRHISLAAATQILVKVDTGHVSLLGRLGITTKDATGATISQEAAIQKLSHLYGGQASAYAQTFSGKMQTLEATAKDLGTGIGLWLIPKIEAVASVGADAVEWLDKNRVAADALGIVIGGPLAVAMGAFLVLKVQSTVEGIAKAFDLLTGSSGRAAAAAATDATAESAAAAANAAEDTAALGGVAALGAEAAAQEAEAAAASTRAAAEEAAAASGALDGAAGGAAGIGEAAGGVGLAAGAIGTLGVAASIAAIPLGMIAFNLHSDAEEAKSAKTAVSDYLSGIQAGAQNAVNPTKYLGDQQRSLGQKIAQTEDQIAAAKQNSADRGVAANEFQQRSDTTTYQALQRRLGVEKTEWAALATARKKSDDTTTTNHAKAQAEQTAATEKAIAKEKHDVGTALSSIGMQYGAYNADVLAAQDLSSTALQAIEKNVSSAVSATDSSIAGFTDIVSQFGNKTKVASGDILKYLTNQVTGARTWATDLKTAAADGIDQGLIQELYKAGPTSEGLVKGILQTVGKGGKDTLNTLVAQARDVETNANSTLSSIMIQGETNWQAGVAWYASHPIVGYVSTVPTSVRTRAGVIGTQGARAAGGDVDAGSSYVVGEMGPEVVKFGANGHVFPHGTPMASGGDTHYYSIEINAGAGTNTVALERAVLDALSAHVGRGGTIPQKVAKAFST